MGKAPDGLNNNDLVVKSLSFRPVTGILIERIHTTGPNIWWRVLCDDGLVVEETEGYMTLLEDAQ